MVIQKNVFGEAHDQFYGVPPEQRVGPAAITDVAPSLVPPPAPAQAVEPTQHTNELPEARAEAIDREEEDPTPTIQQRPFSAPQLEWDATRYGALNPGGNEN
jgi:glycogenin glucosyltransferase